MFNVFRKLDIYSISWSVRRMPFAGSQKSLATKGMWLEISHRLLWRWTSSMNWDFLWKRNICKNIFLIMGTSHRTWRIREAPRTAGTCPIWPAEHDTNKVSARSACERVQTLKFAQVLLDRYYPLCRETCFHYSKDTSLLAHSWGKYSPPRI